MRRPVAARLAAGLALFLAGSAAAAGEEAAAEAAPAPPVAANVTVTARPVVEEVRRDPGQGEDDAPGVELAAPQVERVEAREVDLDVGLGVDEQPLHGVRRLVDGRERAVVEVLGVGEEQR